MTLFLWVLWPGYGLALQRFEDDGSESWQAMWFDDDGQHVGLFGSKAEVEDVSGREALTGDEAMMRNYHINSPTRPSSMPSEQPGSGDA